MALTVKKAKKGKSKEAVPPTDDNQEPAAPKRDKPRFNREHYRAVYLQRSTDPARKLLYTLAEFSADENLSQKLVEQWSAEATPTWTEQAAYLRTKIADKAVALVAKRHELTEANIRLEQSQNADKMISAGMRTVQMYLECPWLIPDGPTAVALIRLGLDAQRQALGLPKDFDMAKLAEIIKETSVSDGDASDPKVALLGRIAGAVERLMVEANSKLVDVTPSNP